MIKFLNYYITFQEVPDEISLVFTITNCRNRCKGCHSPWLRDDIGTDLSEYMVRIIEKYKQDITCVCFMGDGGDPTGISAQILAAKAMGMKTCLYTGNNYFFSELDNNIKNTVYGQLDYLKLGPYEEELGGLDSLTTNQRMVKWNQEQQKYEDVTSWFWRKKI